MKLIKKNIWSLFVAIFLFSTLFLLILSYSQWREVYSDYTKQNENLTKLIAQSTENYFEQLDIVLTLLGKQLLENENYKKQEKSKELLSEMLSINKSISAYALIKPNGDFILTNTDVNPKKIPNLIKREESRQSFLSGLKTTNLTIGRTYLLPISQKFAIPVRKTFFDKNNNPIAVVSIAIPVKNSNLFDEKILKSYSHVINIFRETDFYRQLYIYKTEEEKLEDIYTKPLSKKANDLISSQMKSKYNKSREEIKEEEQTVSFEFKNRVNNYKYLISTQYMKKYKLWPSSYVRYDEIFNKFLKSFLIYLLAYFLVIAIIWYLFNHIYKNENEQKKFLKYKATHDSLTNLPNRYYLDIKTNKWIEKKSNFFLVYIDLDNFKYVNDTFGHKVGDDVLKEISKKIQSVITKQDLFIRQSGDEFIILSENSTIKKYCKDIIDAINKTFEIDNKQFRISASLGVSNYPKDSSQMEDLIICADIACYNAKKIKNSYVLFTEDIKRIHLENIQIEKELKTALERDELYLVFQPQINYDNSIHGVEALVRWENKNLGFMRPDNFISIAENCGMMPVLGGFIIDSALKQLKELQDKTSTKFQISINISVKQFMELDFYDSLMRRIKLYKIDPSFVTLEVTESVFMDNLDYLVEVFNKLREEGITISLDDFGTGYSSLSLLRKMPINELKIDKAFIDDIISDESAQHMVKTIITIGKILNYHIVLAEGVEDKKQVELLNEFGCSTYQGYYFSKPLKIEELERFIKNKF